MRKLTLSLAVMAALLPGRGYPLGLGEIELNSALNQELDAEVEVLSAAPEDAEQLIIKLGDREAFARAGIDRPFMLTQLKFRVVTKNNKPYVKIYTQKPIREPFLSFLVEIDWPEGHLLREYTLLLDPPVYSGRTQPSQGAAQDSGRPFIDPADQSVTNQSVTAQGDFGRPAEQMAYQPSVPVQTSQRAAPAAQPVISSQDSRGQVTYQPLPQYAQSGGNYRVQSQDTLWGIASKHRPDSSVSVEQMMLALVRENPEAFIKENIHGVKRGYILRMPDRSTITSIDRQAALAQVKQHTSLWREYRQALTGAAPASAMESDQDVTSEGISEEVTEGRLSIVSASGDEGSESAGSGQDTNAEIRRLRNELLLAQEALESERLEKENLSSRLADLESRVQNALEMDDAELARLQQELQDARESAPIDTVEEPVSEEPLMEQATEETVVEEVTETEPVTEEVTADTTVTEEEAAPVSEEEAVFVDEAAEAGTVEEAAEPVRPAPVAPVTPVDAPEFAQQQPKTFIEGLLDDPKILTVIAGGLSALVLLVALVLRRRRINKSEEWVELEPDTGGLEFETEGEQHNTLSFQTDEQDVSATTEVAASGLDTAEAGLEEEPASELGDTVIGLAEAEEEKPASSDDDVISEADVYLAYGIYQQAEELLQNAIQQNPDRDDYRMKLLETHFAAKNADAFASLAEEVQQRKGGDKEFWDRVVVMGRELCPDQALFSGDVDLASDLDVDSLIPEKPEATDFELDAEGSALADDLDLGIEDADAEQTAILSEPLSDDLAVDDLNLGDALEDIASEMEMPTAESDEEMSFDLGDLADESEIATSDAETESELELDDEFSLDFEASDLGFENTGAMQVETTEEESSADELEMDSDLDLALDMDKEAISEPEAEETDLGLDLDSDLGLDMETSSETEADLSLDTDLSLELDTDTDEETDLGLDLDMGDTSDEELAMDLTVDTDLSLEADDSSDMEFETDLSLDTSAMAAMPEVAGDDEDFDISELSEDIDEVNTKLELARAYIDMGDKEGARSILEEVKLEGNGDQQSAADELLKEAS